MSLRIAALAVAFATALPAAAAAGPAQRPGAAVQSTPRAAGMRADTLRYQVRAGQPLLVSLPPTAGGRPAAYRVVSAPAMSWLVDRSFFWQTLATESGRMSVVFEQTAASDETLVLVIDIVA